MPEPREDFFAEKQNKRNRKDVSDQTDEKHPQPRHADRRAEDDRAAQFDQRNHRNEKDREIRADMLAEKIK